MNMKLSIRGNWLWGVIVAILMTFGHSSKALADGPYMTPKQQSLTYGHPYTSFKLYLTENNKKFSYWNGKKGYWTIKWDGKDLCTAADLNLNKGTKALMNLKKYGSWYAEYYNEKLGVWVGAYNPQNGYSDGKQHDDECWVEIYIIPSNQFHGQSHKVTVSGYWSSNDGKYKWYDLSYDVKSNYGNVGIGTLNRVSEDKVEFTGGPSGEWECENLYVDLLTSKGETGKLYDTKLSASVKASKNTAGMTYKVDNAKIYTFYPRQRYSFTKYVLKDKKPARPLQIIRDFPAQTVTTCPEIKFGESDVNLLPGEKYQNKFTTNGDGVATYSSANPDIVSVDASTGELMAHKEGKTTITLNMPATKNYSLAKASYKVTVNAYTFAQSEFILRVGDSITQKLTTYTDTLLTYYSSNPTYVSVDKQTGEVKVLRNSKYKITITGYTPQTDNCQQIRATYDIYVLDPDSNLISQVFTVGNTRKVQFAKSNIYWDGSAFKFEATPTDYPTSWDANHVGHFFWTNVNDFKYENRFWYNGEYLSTKPYADTYRYSVQKMEDQFWCAYVNMIKVEGKENLFNLQSYEWEYLFKSRANASNLYKNCVTVGTVANCVVIAPDDYDFTNNPLKDSYTLDEIDSLGFVCLPPAGYRVGTKINGGGNGGQYWTGTHFTGAYNIALNFYFASQMFEDGLANCNVGSSVRLAKIIKE